MVGSYPLSRQAPTHVQVELGCDNWWPSSGRWDTPIHIFWCCLSWYVSVSTIAEWMLPQGHRGYLDLALGIPQESRGQHWTNLLSSLFILTQILWCQSGMLGYISRNAQQFQECLWQPAELTIQFYDVTTLDQRMGVCIHHYIHDIWHIIITLDYWLIKHNKINTNETNTWYRQKRRNYCYFSDLKVRFLADLTAWLCSIWLFTWDNLFFTFPEFPEEIIETWNCEVVNSWLKNTTALKGGFTEK